MNYLKSVSEQWEWWQCRKLSEWRCNGIPDIIDEIKWGLDWLNRMNPEPGELYNQIADDRDHAGMRLPSECMVDYGYGPGKGRPVYFCSGEPQVRGKFMNATTGVASTAGKFASTESTHTFKGKKKYLSHICVIFENGLLLSLTFCT